MNFFVKITSWLFHSYEEFCELNLTYFKIFGLFQMVNPYNRVKNYNQIIWLYFHACIMIFTGLHTVTQFVSLFLGNLDYKKAMNTFTHIGNWTIAALKFVNFAYNRERLNFLFDVFRMDFLNVTDIKERKRILYDHAYTCNWFILVYVCSCLFTCCVWNIYPVAELLYYSLIFTGNTTYTPKNILDSWYPFNSEQMPIFYYIYVYEFFIYFYMLFAFCCYDSYLFSMFTMMTAQFEVLNNSFSDIGYDRPIKGYDPHLDELFLFRPEDTLPFVREKLFKSINSESQLYNLALFRTEQLLDAQRSERVVHVKGAEETRKAQEFLDSLLQCTTDLQKANRYANELIEVYNDVIIFQVLISIITICLMAFQTVVVIPFLFRPEEKWFIFYVITMKKRKIEFQSKFNNHTWFICNNYEAIEFQYFSGSADEFTGTLQISKSLLYFACAFLLLLLSCKCSGDLNDARKGINAAFYNAHWHEFELPQYIIKSLLFSMTCNQRSHVVEITHRFPVDLHTFSEIAEICFSYFTFLLNYYQKKGH